MASTPNPGSGSNTPNPRFTSQTKTAEDLLANQTVGLVALSDFRKRRAEAIEQKEKDAHAAHLGTSNGRATPASGASGRQGDGASTPAELKKKKKRKVGSTKLSFGLSDEEDSATSTNEPQKSRIRSPRSGSPLKDDGTLPLQKKKLTANTSLSTLPKALTKAALLREAQTRETLRKEFLVIQEAVKATEICIPFVFYDGTNIPGGVCRVKKGDFIWVFLDRSRKVGAKLAAAGSESGEGRGRRDWARVGVDDLLMVRGEVIIPHHYDFYFFIMNRNRGPAGRLLFDYKAEAPKINKTDESNTQTYNPLARQSKAIDTKMEGYSDDPVYTKVVDRRWYERNKHIYPASVWHEFDPEKDYKNEIKRDAGGNAFFIS